jgi:hypothetical protein
MRKIAVLIAALCALPVLADSGAYSYYTYTNTATSGNALTSEVVDARDLENLTIVGQVATADRAITVNCLANDGATVLFAYPAITAAFATAPKKVIQIRPDGNVPGTPPTNTTVWNTTLCPKMNVVMASAAGTAQLDIMGRRQQVNANVQVSSYESGSVIAGAALASGTIDTRRVESMVILVEATTTNRALVISCTNSAGTSLFDFASFTVTAANKYLHQIRPDSPTPGSEPTNVTHYPLELCRYMKATVAAAGAASAKLAVYTRN